MAAQAGIQATIDAIAKTLDSCNAVSKRPSLILPAFVITRNHVPKHRPNSICGVSAFGLTSAFRAAAERGK